jgi:hypothetical protein
VRYTSVHFSDGRLITCFIIWSEYMSWWNKHGRFSTMGR